ncbi:MAG: hypothetical protein CFH34_01746, partial [Alphaproteobacteria bacterium MarineAlpha9_Bin4]
TRLENEKVAKGAGLASNVLQSKARLAGARSTRVKFEGDLAIAKNRFFNVFRELPDIYSTFSDPNLPINLLPTTEEQAIEIARENNIALKISNLNLKNSKTKIKQSKSKFLPSLKAIAQYKNKRNVSGIEGTEIDHTYKLEMNYPISIGGPSGFFYKENADYKASMNDYMMAKYNHDQLERNLEESVRNSWQTKNIAKQNYDFLENQANISGEFFDLAMKEVKLGNRQLIDILSSETAFINSKSAAENAKTEYKLAVYQLLFAIGILDEKVFKDNLSIKKKNNKIISKTIKNKSKLTNNNKKKVKVGIEKKITSLTDKKTLKTKKENKEISIYNEDANKAKAKNIDYKEKNNREPIALINKKVTILEDSTSDTKPSVLFTASKISAASLKENDTYKKIKNTKTYKIQLGAFGKLANAERLLNELISMEFELVKLIIDEDSSAGLFKIRSIENFSKKQAQNICFNLKSIDINCILSKFDNPI